MLQNYSKPSGSGKSTRIAIIFPRPAGGFFSHFAHFVSDFVFPFFSVLRRHDLVKEILEEEILLEIKDVFPMKFGPMLPLAQEIFPGLKIEYTARFTKKPIRLCRDPWYNRPDDVDCFITFLKKVLVIKQSEYGVIIVRRGLARDKYPGGNFLFKSGADRRTIVGGLENLISCVTERRRDTICIELESCSLSEQVSLFLSADTLIGQHGAAFVHSHWMPKGSHLIEFQCTKRKLCPGMIFQFARIRKHKVSIVNYDCHVKDNCLCMNIDDATKVVRLLTVSDPRIGNISAT